jgi:nicotinate-nucleotide pyrophosphorylase (carboxylating)
MTQNSFFLNFIKSDIAHFLNEDQLGVNHHYLHTLPTKLVECHLKIKSDLMLCGLPYFTNAFIYLGAEQGILEIEKNEGKNFCKDDIIKFKLPFNIALSGERVALNLLQRASSIATFTSKFVEKANKLQIKILDTRKTTPGLRSLEKYAVRVGGGYNHRFTQMDVFMIKDNHKNYFGSLKNAFNYFHSQQNFYLPIMAEIHSLDELKSAIELGIDHVMLDNFSKENIQKAISLKKNKMTFEISGGVNLNNLDQFLVEGIDVISIGALTHSAPHVDLSLKLYR